MLIPKSLLELPRWCLADPTNKFPFSAVDNKPIKHNEKDKLVTAYQFTPQQMQDLASKNVRAGFVLSQDLNITCIDIDGKNYNEDPERFNKLIKAFNSYTERSQSGTGFHVWVQGTIKDGGRRFNQLEVYSDKRYIMVTGDHITESPGHLIDRQKLLDELIATAPVSEYACDAQDIEIEPTIEDEQVLEKAIQSANGEKFSLLYQGKWRQLGYPSQSEADHALIEMLCFHTQSNNQVRDLFYRSGLMRVQHNKGYAYVTRSLLKSRNIQNYEKVIIDLPPPPRDLINVTQESLAIVKPAQSVDYPPGFVGLLAREFTERSVSCIPEVSIAGALGVVSGIVGKAYTTVHGGSLNGYFLVLGKSGIGKDALFSGTEKLLNQMSAVHSPYHLSDFLDFNNYASMQALGKAMRAKSSFAHFCREFGHDFTEMCTVKNNPQMKMHRQLLLSVFSGGKLGTMAYSNTENNINGSEGVAYTIVGEAIGSLLFRNMTEETLSSGFLSRFTMIEYKGDRVEHNGYDRTPFSETLVSHLQTIVDEASKLKMPSGTSFHSEPKVVQISDKADEMSQGFFKFVSSKLKGVDRESYRQKWVRQHEKALRVAAVLAVADNPYEPIMTTDHMQWAIRLMMHGVNLFDEREKMGDIGNVESGFYDAVDLVFNRISQLYSTDDHKLTDFEKLSLNQGIVSKSLISRNVKAYAAFRNTKDKNLFDNCIRELCDCGKLMEVNGITNQTINGKTGKWYKILDTKW